MVLLWRITFQVNLPVLPDSPGSENLRFSASGLHPETQSAEQDKIYQHFVKWNKVSNDDKRDFSELLDSILNEFFIDGIICCDKFCSNESHKHDLETAYTYLVEAVKFSSDTCLPSFSSQLKSKVIPGWNKHCKGLYAIARDRFFLWNSIGRPRSGVIFEDMKQARIEFRNSLNYCRKNEQKLKKEAFLESFKEKHKTNFWAKVRKISPNNKNSQTIDGISDPLKINKLLSEKFRVIFDNPGCRSVNSGKGIKSNVDDDLLFFHFRKQCIDKGIEKVNNGLGLNYVHSNHLKFGGQMFRIFLGKFYASMMAHSFIPKEMLRGHIKPTIKNNKTCKTNSNNYRPVMNSCLFLKILEYCLYDILIKKLKIHPLQFGFTRNSSCANAITFSKKLSLLIKIMDQMYIALLLICQKHMIQ